jgi:hypothetical protein
MFTLSKVILRMTLATRTLMLTVPAVAWASRNSYSVGTRTITASVYNMCVQAGNIVYVSGPSAHGLDIAHCPQSQIYRSNDAVRFISAQVLICSLTLLCSQASVYADLG